MELDALAHALAADGIAAHELEIASFLRAIGASAVGCPTLRSLLADRTAPAVVRERAFGLLAALADRPGAGTSVADADRADRRTVSAAA